MASQSAIAFPWNRLPPELRLMIKQELLQSVSTAGKNPLYRWAGVSKEWYSMFAPFIWHTIRLHSGAESDISNFKRWAIGLRRRFIEKIIFHVNLQEYNCQQCGQQEGVETVAENNVLFSYSLDCLFSALYSWTKKRSPRGIILVLRASSPSDLYHVNTSLREHKREVAYQSPGHSILNAKKRLVGGLLEFVLDESELPKLTVVDEFVIGAGSRSLSPSAITSIIRKLPLLQGIIYEPWRGVDKGGQLQRDAANLALLQCASAVSGLRSVALWEAQPQKLHGRRYYSEKPVNIPLTLAAVAASFKLELLCISHAIDAMNFLQRFCEQAEATQGVDISSPPVLKRLALTFQVQALLESRTRVDDLLLVASRAAMFLPHLELMEVWSPGKGLGFFFRYEINQNTAKLRVVATWQVTLTRNKEVLDSWQQVAYRHGCDRFGHDIERIDPRELPRSTSISEHLKY